MGDRKIRVVVIAPSPESLELLKGQAGYMRSRGMEMIAISRPGPELEAFSRSEKVEIHPLRVPPAVAPMGDFGAFPTLLRLLFKLRPDIVHAHTSTGGLLGMGAAWVAGIPGRIYTMHSLPFDGARGFERSVLRLSERLTVALSRRVYVVSGSLRDQALRLGVTAPGGLGVLGPGTVNGVDAEGSLRPSPDCCYEAARVRRAVALPSEARVIGYVGPVSRSKGFDDLVESWSQLRVEFADLRMLVVGALDSVDPVSGASRTLLQTDPRIHWTGRLRSMRGLYAAMDVVVIPSHRDGFPQAALESAAMGRPVVATAVTGCVDAVCDGWTGTLVDPRNPPALARAIRVYLRDPELRQRHGRAARERALRDYRPEEASFCTYWAYREVLGRARYGPPRSTESPRGRSEALLGRALGRIRCFLAGDLPESGLPKGLASRTGFGPAACEERRSQPLLRPQVQAGRASARSCFLRLRRFLGGILTTLLRRSARTTGGILGAPRIGRTPAVAVAPSRSSLG